MPGGVPRLPAFRGATEKELLAWLRQVLSRNLSNLVRHYAGTQRRDVRLEVRLVADVDDSAAAIEAGLAAAGPSPSQQADRREQAALLAEAIVLRTLRGLSFPDVAARLNRSTDAPEKLWARALIRLRREMGVGP